MAWVGGRGVVIGRGKARKRVNSGQACVAQTGGVHEVADEVEARKGYGTEEQKKAGVGRHL